MSFQKIAKEIAGYVLGREQEIEIAMTALLAEQHYAMIGAPGTAKSLMFSCLAQHFSDARYFQVTVDRATPKDDLFGPVSVQGLKEDDLRRNTKNRLPEAHIAFIDEAFKASSATLNALLTILNERLFENGREGLRRVPLQSVFVASNEYPGDDGGDSVAALWDRFLLRSEIGYLNDQDARSMLDIAQEYQPNTLMTLTDLKAAINEAKCEVKLADEYKDALIQARRILREDHGVTISDRRLRQSVRLLTAKARLEGRSEVIADDLMILQHSLWNDRDERSAIAAVLMRCVDPCLVEINELIEETETHRTVLTHKESTRLEMDEAFAKLDAVSKKITKLKNMANTDIARATATRAIEKINDLTRSRFAEVFGGDLDFSIR